MHRKITVNWMNEVTKLLETKTLLGEKYINTQTIELWTMAVFKIRKTCELSKPSWQLARRNQVAATQPHWGTWPCLAHPFVYGLWGDGHGEERKVKPQQLVLQRAKWSTNYKTNSSKIYYFLLFLITVFIQ